MGIFDIFNRGKPVTETESKSYNAVVTTRATGGYASSDKLEDIYKGTDRNYDLAAGSFNKQILTVARLTGTPVIQNGAYPRVQSVLFDEAIIITLRAMINGTHWALPRVMADGSAGIEHIKDSAIGSGGLRLDPDSGALTAVVLHENVEWLDGYFLNEIKWAERRRKFTADEIAEVWTGGKTSRSVRKNSLGVMPVPFAFNSLGDIRGTSAYSGVLRLLRDIHEVRRNRDEILARAKPKAVIKSSDWNEWTNRNMAANGHGDRYRPFDADVVTNKADEEFLFLALPAGVVSDHNAALEDNSREQIVSSPLPEIFNGKMTTGNYASNEYQQQQAIQFVRSVRDEMGKSWNRLVKDLARLDGYLHFTEGEPPEITWDNLELASPLTRSQIMANCVSALSQMSSSGIPAEACFYMLKELQPQMPYDTAGELADAMRAAKADTVPEDTLGDGASWGL
jgi:hypothetical protein